MVRMPKVNGCGDQAVRPMMTWKHKLTNACLALSIATLAVSGFMILASSYLPFTSVEARMDVLSLDGKADSFNTALFEQIVVKSRFAGAALLLSSGLVYIARRQAQQHIYDLLVSFCSFARELLRNVNRAVEGEDRIHLYALLAILTLAIVIRLSFLFQPMRYDEAYTFLHYASRPLYIGLSNYSAPNNHLFHTLLVHLAYLLLGNRPWVIRLPALLAGILLVPTSYLVTRIFYNKYAALLTAGLVAPSSILIEYSTNARGYTMICLIFLLLLALATYLRRSRNSAAWLLFAALSALGFYTIPIMLYPFGIVVVWLLLSIALQDTSSCRRALLGRLLVSLIVSALLTFLLYVPVLVVSEMKSVAGNSFVLSESWSYFTEQLPPSVYSVWGQWNRDIPAAMRLLVVAGFFIALIRHKHLSRYRIPVIVAVLLWVVPVLILQRVLPFERVWLFLLPLYVALACSGMSHLLELIVSKIGNHKSIVFAVLAIALSLWLGLSVVFTQSIFYSNETGTLRDAEAITIFLRDFLEPGDVVLVVSHAPLEYYFRVYGVSVKHLSSVGPDFGSARRILVLVDESRDQTLTGVLGLTGVLDQGGLLDVASIVPRTIKPFEFATLYGLNTISETR